MYVDLIVAPFNSQLTDIIGAITYSEYSGYIDIPSCLGPQLHAKRVYRTKDNEATVVCSGCFRSFFSRTP